MTQKPNLNIDNSSGQIVRLDIQNALQAVATHNFGQRNAAGTILPCEFLADDTSNKLLIRKSSGGDQANPNPPSGTAATFFTVGNLDEENLGLLPKGGGVMTGVLQASAGSVSAPAINFGDSGTGFYRADSNILGVSCGGSNQFNFSTTEFQSKSDIGIEKTGTDAALQLRTNSNSNNAIVDLASDTTTKGLDFGLRLMRTGGADGFSTLHHRSTSDTASNLIINSQAKGSGGILLQTGGDCTTTPETTSKSRFAVAHNGGILAGEAIRTNVDPVLASGNVGNAIKLVTASATEEYGSFGLAVSAKDVVGIFNRTNTVGTIVEFKYNATICGLVSTANGTTTSFVTNPSDRTLKKNFESWNENTLDLFKNLNPQKYNYISEDDTAEKSKGFIAQEVADSFPDAYPKNEDDKYMFNPSGMVVYLMKALQEAVAKIETLEAKVAVLEAK